MTYNSRAFGLVISRIRTARGISQERLSAFAGIARSHLTALENGRKVARLDTFFCLAEALEMSPADLMRLTEEECMKGVHTLPGTPADRLDGSAGSEV